MTTPDFPDYGTPQAHATAISTTGTPLLHGANTLDNHTTYNVPAGGFSSPFYVFSKPGYVAEISALATAGSAKPFLGLNLFWDNNAAGSHGVAQESWTLPAATGQQRCCLKGPVKGGSATFQLHNLDTVNVMPVTVDLIETTHHIARDDMRCDPCATVPGFTGAGGDPFGNILGAQIAATVPASSFKQWLLPPYSGQVVYNLFQSGPAVSLTTTFQAQDFTAGQPIFFWHNADSGAVQGPFTVNLPRCPTVLTLTNNATTAATVNWAVIPVEYAS